MKNILLIALITSWSTLALSYSGTMDTGDILPSGKYRVMLGPQFVLSGENDGVNVAARFDAGVSQSSNLRGVIGSGKTSFFSSLLYKWVPIPDFENQPAVGVMGGFTFFHQKWDKKEQDAMEIKIHPIVSKQFETNVGVFTPYASLPVGITFVKGTSYHPLQLVGGTEFKTFNWQNISFFAELGLKINDAYSYVELSMAYYFDGEK